jgi:CRP/FNR family transcriptional regulator, cyclic AMP receptor protein
MARNQYYEHLRSVPMFAELGPRELDVIGQAATELHLEAGNMIVKEGNTAHEMFVVMDGVLEVTRGGEHVADIGPGGFAGEMALLTHAKRHADVVAKTDVIVLHIDGRSFAGVLEQVPQIAVKMLPIVASRVIENNEHHAL